MDNDDWIDFKLFMEEEELKLKTIEEVKKEYQEFDSIDQDLTSLD
tara:strand:+ start:2423 stop:2557 length:135 start_codon:yes stop_codon:yes gene_type:complete